MKDQNVKENKRPVKELRDQLRRSQIVSAAQHCVVRHGFHAASMGQIAAEAQMSVGQIYRYFPSKDAIVHAIVESIVDRRLAWMLDRTKEVNFAAEFAHRRPLSPTLEGESDRVLLLEITAEATRNPAVAEIVRGAHQRLHSQAIELVLEQYPHLSEAEASARVEFVAVLSEGSAFRSVNEQVMEPALLEALYTDVLQQLFPQMTDKQLLR